MKRINLYLLGTFRDKISGMACYITSDGHQDLLFMPERMKSEFNCITEKLMNLKIIHY